MKRYLKYIKEIFETKHYYWIIKSDLQYIAKFNMNNDDYFIHFDSIGKDAYNLYFYYIDLEGNKIYDLVNHIDNRSYKVISNVKKCIEEFLTLRDVDFIGYSSFDKERDSLYTLMLQNIRRENDIIASKHMNKKKYYFLYSKDIKMESNLYINKFIQNDDNLKKDKSSIVEF